MYRMSIENNLNTFQYVFNTIKILSLSILYMEQEDDYELFGNDAGEDIEEIEIDLEPPKKKKEPTEKQIQARKKNAEKARNTKLEKVAKRKAKKLMEDSPSDDDSESDLSDSDELVLKPKKKKGKEVKKSNNDDRVDRMEKILYKLASDRKKPMKTINNINLGGADKKAPSDNDEKERKKKALLDEFGIRM
jgi:hypothetical protein